MIKHYILILSLWLTAFVCIGAQVPINVGIQILKAEDALRYDAVLERLIRSPNALIRKRAVLAAGRIGDARAIGPLSELLANDKDVSVRAMAAFAIGEIESIQGTDAILKTLLDSSTPHDVTARAAEAAGKIAGANANDEKSKQLGAALLSTLDAELKKTSATNSDIILLGLTAVLRSRPAGSEETVRKFLAFTDPNIVATALNTLARLRAKNANRDARDLLATHVNAIVRANAARVLAAAEDKEALDILIKAATTDGDSRVRVSAIRALGALKDAKAADPLLTRGEALFDVYKKTWKPNYIPAEQNEFIEIATSLGRIIPNAYHQRADDLFRAFGKIDKGHATEVYIARTRIGQRRGDPKEAPELTDWHQYSTLAQIVGEFASIEPTSDVGKAMKSEAPGVLRPLASAFASADP
ncbi:MAG: HEAT repeat domain-containing protein, partial [Pyrinomonadaceae bacterium]